MARVDAFNKGRVEKDDEFYTRYEDIQEEMNHYDTFFKNKTVLCNCDDPFESNFCKFFLRNFNYLGLKRLICTSYVSSPVVGTQMTIFDYLDEPVQKGHGYVMDISEVPMANGRGVSDDDIEKLLKSKKRGVKKLEGDGDFRSEECIEYLKQADIVVTNPPFSKFIEYITTLLLYDKQFLIIGRETAVSYKEVFPLMKENKVWLGYSHAKEFYRPDGTVKKFGNVLWFTNLDVSKRHEDIILFKSYNPDIYPSYENFKGIDVASVAEIPKDYDGCMGVPVSFMNLYNPDQFEIIGYGKGKLGQSVGVIGIKPEHKKLMKNHAAAGDLYYMDNNGTPKTPFARILIKRRRKR